MSKMEPHRDFKASIDNRLKTSIDLDRMNGEAGVPSGTGYICLGVQISKGTAQRQPHRRI